MIDEAEVQEVSAEPVAADPAPLKVQESHESFIARIEAAFNELPNPTHLIDWLKQEFAKFRA